MHRFWALASYVCMPTTLDQDVIFAICRTPSLEQVHSLLLCSSVTCLGLEQGISSTCRIYESNATRLPQTFCRYSAGKLFKSWRRRRTGQRVIVTGSGDIIVRPQPLELRMQLKLPGGAACICHRPASTCKCRHALAFRCCFGMRGCAFLMELCKRRYIRKAHAGCSQA